MGPAFERVRERLHREGRLTFAAFMAETLHGPEGYYTRRPRLGGADADFFTSPELHPAFGALLGRLAAQVWVALGRPAVFDLVEHGPGTGALCRDLLDWADHEAPELAQAVRYHLIEVSAPLQAVQRETLTSAGLPDSRVTWEETPSPTPHHSYHGAPQSCLPWGPLPPRPHGPARGRSLAPSPSQGEGRGGGFSGLILANELVDALPVHLVTMRDGRLLERYVVWDGDRLGWQDDTPSTEALSAYFERLGVWPGEGCLAEVNLAGIDWLEQTAASLDRGGLLVLDYGYPASELYAPTRRHGTLLTYSGHTLGSDPLRNVGAQDITAHVDFTSLARAGERGGLVTVGLISQAALLRKLGIDDFLRQLDRSTLAGTDHDANRRALLALIEPDGLGRIQGLLQTRSLSHPDALVGDHPDRAPGSADDWLPLLRAGQMRLPGPLEAEGFVDLEGQWRELFQGASDDESPS